ncbi:MAG: aldehyde ferredoxin oxidoreductase family protein [Desulfobacterales bacterium]|nr:aldehyde ferredoxin oxidoreductase family protein [Desulfobacterales bacterium]
MSTLTAKLLRINLNVSNFIEEKISDQHVKRFISARGLGAIYLFDELAPAVDPLSPDNKLLLLVGALGGTGLQGFSKWMVMSKSPLTGTVFRSVTGGNFGIWMKHAGYDLMIIEGKAATPTYIHLDEGGVHFLDAAGLWGLNYRRLQAQLKETHGQRTESACIGPAGENLVRYAVIHSGERTASRGGMGTVMGSKNLKAVSINVPAKKPSPFDPIAFKDLVKTQVNILKEHPRKQTMTTLGTPYITKIVNMMGILPTKNYQEGSIPNIEELSGDRFFELKKARAGCYNCMTRCGGMRAVNHGPFKGSQIDGPEYETIFAFGPLVGLSDRQFIIDANAMCDVYGIDTISTGVCVAFACELFARGMISPVDTEGLRLAWGNKEAIFSLIEQIGQRRGFGRLLGEGVQRAAAQLGGDAPSLAMHIKGLELPGYDPRGVKGYALSMATSNIGGSHMYGRPREEFSGQADPLAETGKGAMIARVQKEQALEDSLIACTFGNTGLDADMYARLLLAATGIDHFGSAENLLKIGERIVSLERCFNVREGFDRKDDTLPKRMRREPLLEAGPATDHTVANLEHLLDEYYRALGYTSRGIPGIDQLQALDLPEAAESIKAFAAT